MKNHKEMFEALLEGEILESFNADILYKLENGVLHTCHKPNDDWKESSHFPHPINVQIKQKTIDINGFVVPEPVKLGQLKEGAAYYYLRISASSSSWDNDIIDKDRLACGVIHATKEAAELHAKALLSFTKKD